MRWANKHETYEEKYQRVVKAIEKAGGDEVIVVGESAGGAMTLLALSRQAKQISRVVTICGYNHGAADVNPMHKIRHPAFYRLMPVVDELVAKLDGESRARILTIYSTRDTVVRFEHSRIEGAKAIVLHTPGHFSNIARALIAKYPLK